MIYNKLKNSYVYNGLGHLINTIKYNTFPAKLLLNT
jgi:hypothetical protein